MGIAGVVCGLWAGTRATRGALTRRYGRPVRRASDSARVPTDALDVVIPTGSGAVLRGWMRRPVDASEHDGPGPAAIVIHGWGAGAEDMVPLSEPLVEAGLHVLLLDARGHGRSDDVDVASMPSFAEDLRAALGWLRRRPEIDPDRIVLVGHSVGAGAALFVAADDHAIAGVVSLSSMAAPREFMARQLRTRLPGPLVGPALRYVEHVVEHRYSEFSPLSTIGRVTAPVLLVHGARDGTIPWSDAERLHARAPDRSTLVVLPDAGHADLESIQEGEQSLLRFLKETGILAEPQHV